MRLESIKKCLYCKNIFKIFIIFFNFRLNSISSAIRLDERDLFKEISKHIFEIQEFRDLGHNIMAYLKVSIFMSRNTLL